MAPIDAISHIWQTTALVNERYLELLKTLSLQIRVPDRDAEQQATRTVARCWNFGRMWLAEERGASVEA